MREILVFDNRNGNCQDFEQEANLASFHRHNAVITRKICCIGVLHPWVRAPLALLIASSSERMKLVGSEYVTEQTMEDIEDPKYSITTFSDKGLNVVKKNWTVFLTSAIDQIQNFFRVQLPIADDCCIVIFSHSLNLLSVSPEHKEEILEAVEIFCSALDRITLCCPTEKVVPNVIIRIVCVNVSTSSGSRALFDLAELISFRLHQSTRHFTSFAMMTNSQLHYDEELRTLVSLQVPVFPGALRLPPTSSSRCAPLRFSLLPATLSSVAHGHAGFTQAEIFCAVPRSGIRPTLIEGASFFVQRPRKDTAENGSRLNLDYDATFSSLLLALARAEQILVLHVPLPSHNGTVHSGGGASMCVQYWALVPPDLARLGRLTEEDDMVLIKLSDRDSVINCSIEIAANLQSGASDASSMLTTADDVDADRAEMDAYMRSVLEEASAGSFNPLACPAGWLEELVATRSIPRSGAGTVSTTRPALHAHAAAVADTRTVGGGSGSSAYVLAQHQIYPPPSARAHQLQQLPQRQRPHGYTLSEKPSQHPSTFPNPQKNPRLRDISGSTGGAATVPKKPPNKYAPLPTHLLKPNPIADSRGIAPIITGGSSASLAKGTNSRDTREASDDDVYLNSDDEVNVVWENCVDKKKGKRQGGGGSSKEVKATARTCATLGKRPVAKMLSSLQSPATSEDEELPPL